MNKLGIDFGKVIMCPTIEGVNDTRFLGCTLDDAMQTPAAPGAISAIAELVELFEGGVWIVSKCGPSVEKKSRAWLEHNRFYEQTGLSRENLRFCLKRHDKAPICKKLGIDNFIDDRLDVLLPMQGHVRRLLLFGEQAPSLRIPHWAQSVANWREVRTALGLSSRERQCT